MLLALFLAALVAVSLVQPPLSKLLVEVFLVFLVLPFSVPTRLLAGHSGFEFELLRFALQ